MIGIAGVFGALSIFAADFWLASQADARVEEMTVAAVLPQPAVAFGTIVVAGQPLAYGTALAPDVLTEIPWPAETLPEGAFPSIEAAMAAGPRIVLSPLSPNEPLLLAKLSGPDGRATLSNLLSPGMRAVTIRTDEIAGVGGFVAPGDRVDVVLTRNAGAIQEVQTNAQGADGSTITSEVVVENARVLSAGQGADERQTAPQVVSSVTLEVTPDQASKIALARSIGTLSLTLRSAGEATAAGNGLTTISAFGGSVGSALMEKASAILADPEPERKFKTVVVTRGMVTESYEVVAPQK